MLTVVPPHGQSAGPGVSRWYASFYWRIGISLVLFLVLVTAAQALLFGFVIARTISRSPGWLPAVYAVDVAANLGAALEQDPSLDLADYLHRVSTRGVFVVMKDGRAAGSTAEPLDRGGRRLADAALSGHPFPDAQSAGPLGPVITAPVQVDGRLAGLVVMPPPAARGIAGDVGRLLLPPGAVLLVGATALAALIIFAPARRRLRALEQAADRLGRGDASARAPDSGGDEIARVARAFNHMAEELSQRSDALVRSDRLRRQMLADVSHEVKTPLTSIRAYLETLRMPDVILDLGTRERHLDTVERETARLERILADLLDLARFENSAVQLDVRLFAVDQVFSHVIDRHAPHAGAMQVTLQRVVYEGADHVTADPHRIEQVVDNLVVNAIRHTPPGGTVRLEAGRSSRGAVLRVIDSGVGIAPEHLPHVFDRFYKVDAARQAADSSGLGLTIAKAIVERHGGSIQVVSMPGRTKFWLELPQLDAAPESE